MDRIFSPLWCHVDYNVFENSGSKGFYALGGGRTDRHTKILFNVHQKPFRMLYNI